MSAAILQGEVCVYVHMVSEVLVAALAGCAPPCAAAFFCLACLLTAAMRRVPHVTVRMRLHCSVERGLMVAWW